MAREAPDVVLLDHELSASTACRCSTGCARDRRPGGGARDHAHASSDPELLVEALRRGAHDYLRTPFDPEELDARVMAALRVKRLHDALLDANHRLALQALTDDLTGLANRRHGAHQLEREIALCVRHGRPARRSRRRRRPLQDDQRHARPPGRRQVLAEVARRLAAAGRTGTSWRAGAATSSSRSCPTPTRPARCARRSACARRSPRTPMVVAGEIARRHRAPSAGRTGRETPRTTSWPAPTALSTRRRTRGATGLAVARCMPASDPATICATLIPDRTSLSTPHRVD